MYWACARTIDVEHHSRPQRPRSFWSAPRIATPGKVQRHSRFEWICKHNRLRPEPIRFVRLDSEHAQSDGKSMNRGLPLLDSIRGRDSWCWPKGARPLGTRMRWTHANSSQFAPSLAMGQRGEKAWERGWNSYDSSEIKQRCVGRSKSYLTYFNLDNWPVITVIFLGNLERVSAKTVTTNLQVIYIWLVPSFEGYSPKFLAKGVGGEEGGEGMCGPNLEHLYLFQTCFSH